MSLPNFLSFIRIFITPIFMLLYLKGTFLGISQVLLPYLLLFICILSELSDAFDGYFARKFSQVTDLGKLLDPMADSVYRISVFLTFTQPPVNLPVLIVFLFLARDSVISTLRTVCALRGFALAARISGKLKAIFQGISTFIILISMIFHSLNIISSKTLQFIATFSVGGVALYALASGVEYMWVNRNYIKQLLKNPR